MSLPHTITIRQVCQKLATILQFTGDVGDASSLMNYLLCYCLKRTLQTQSKEYLHIWKNLREVESFEALAHELQTLITLNEHHA